MLYYLLTILCDLLIQRIIVSTFFVAFIVRIILKPAPNQRDPGILPNQKKEKKKNKIIFLSMAQCHGTIVLQAFGQIPGSTTYNEFTRPLARPNSLYSFKQNFAHHQFVDTMIKIGDSSPGDVFFHEMAKNLSEQELLRLRDHGFKIVGVVRHPGKQIRGPQNHPSMDLNLFVVGWQILYYYWNNGYIDHIIDSQEFLASPRYRGSVVKTLGVVFVMTPKMLENMHFLPDTAKPVRFNELHLGTKRLYKVALDMWYDILGSGAKPFLILRTGL